MPVNNPSLLEVRDEGTSQGFVNALNFTGAGVTATVSGATGTISIPGGGGGASWTTVEVNLGSANWRGKFTVTDAAVSPSSKVIIVQAPGPYTGKGTRADEAEMDPIWCVAIPGSGQFDVLWRTMAGITTTFSDVRGTQPVSSANTQHGEPFRSSLIQMIVGRVKGNVKFNYTVA